MDELNYKVYARSTESGQVERIFSTCFEHPEESDILIKEGQGDDFVHVGYYQVIDDAGCHNYKIKSGEMVETTEKEKAAEVAAFPIHVSSDEKIESILLENAELKKQMALLEECIMELSM